MMKQRSLAASGYERRLEATKRKRFRSEMDVVVPRAVLDMLVNQVQPKRHELCNWVTYPTEAMIWIHFMQRWFDLSDPAMGVASRVSAGMNADNDVTQDRNSILRLRDRLNQHGQKRAAHYVGPWPHCQSGVALIEAGQPLGFSE